MSSVCSRAFGGWLAACGAATAVSSGFEMIVVVIGVSRSPPSPIFLTGSIVPLLVLIDFIFICLLSAIPSAIVICLSEKFRVRSVVFFGCAGAVIGAVCVGFFDRVSAAYARGQGGPIDQPFAIWTSGAAGVFVVAGLAAGVTYWFIAAKASLRSIASEPV